MSLYDKKPAEPPSQDLPDLAPPRFDSRFQDDLLDLFRWRRDVRHFKRDRLPGDLLGELLSVADLAPSVGLSQPWRFVEVESAPARAAILENFRACNADALSSYGGEAAQRYAGLKLSGLEEAPLQLAVFCDETTDQGKGLGRKTIPETLRYSVVAAIQTLWLFARSRGIGMGWVSILDPARLKADLALPEDWTFVAYLCLGYPQEEHLDPELERQAWERRRPLDQKILKR